MNTPRQAMKRLPYLSSHLRNLNRSVATERKRFFRLYPLAVLLVGFSFGLTLQMDKKARQTLSASDPVLPPSQAMKTRPAATVEQKRAVSDGIRQSWVGETRAGEPIRETKEGIKFTF